MPCFIGGGNGSHKTTGDVLQTLTSLLPSLPLQEEALAVQQKALDQKMEAWMHQMELAKRNAETASEQIVLSIGGQLFHTSKTTLLDEHDTFFFSWVHSGLFTPNAQGIFLKR